MLLAAQDDAKGAEKSLREAIGVAPVWYKPHWALALLLEHTNRRDEARKEASAAIERAGKNTEVKATLAHLQ